MCRLGFVPLLLAFMTAMTAPAVSARPPEVSAHAAAARPPEASRNLTCAPTPEVKAALATVPRRDPDCEPEQPCWVEKIRKAEKLLDRYPFDVHLHRRYQDLVSARSKAIERGKAAAGATAGGNAAAGAASSNDAAGDAGEDPITRAASDRYRLFLEAHPDDPLAHYLVARLDDDQAEAEKSLALNPTFPWPHGLLATILRGTDPRPSAEASAAAGAELETFARLCPDRFDEVLRRDRDVGDAALWQRLLPQARAALRKGPPEEQVPWYRALWDREFAAWPPSGHEQVRDRVRADLRLIESWKRRDDETWWQALQQGYKTLDDPPALARVEAGYAKEFPCSWLAVERTVDRFTASIGGQEHLHDQTQAQWRKTYDTTGRWVKTCPDQYRYLSYRFEAADRLDDLDNRTLAAEADRYLAAWDRIAADWFVYPSPYAEVAAALLRRGIDPPRALAAAKKARQEHAHEIAARAGWNDEQKRASEQWDRTVDFDGETLIAEAALAAGRRDECDAALARAGALYHGFGAGHLEALANAPGCHARYWRVRARVAEADRRSADAFAWWRLAIQHADAHTNHRTTDGDRAALDLLWSSLGGTPEGLVAWMAPGPAGPGTSAATRVAASDTAASPGTVAAPGTAAATTVASSEPAATKDQPDSHGWESPGDPLPPFTLTDIDGRTWKLAELTGKTLFINVWATWCGPCKAEIPHLRDLNDRLRDRRDVVLLSFNTDDSAGVVAPFARANRMTWPVLFASAYFESLGGAMSVPQNWIVDGAGVRRAMQLGFDARHPDAWLEGTLGAIERAGAAAPAAGDKASATHP